MNDNLTTNAPNDQPPSAPAETGQAKPVRKPYAPPHIEHAGALEVVTLLTLPPSSRQICG
jgi:hypothetical protein